MFDAVQPGDVAVSKAKGSEITQLYVNSEPIVLTQSDHILRTQTLVKVQKFALSQSWLQGYEKMRTVLIIVLLVLLLGGGGGYYGYGLYGGAGLGGAFGLVLVILLVLWFFGALG